VVLGVSNPFEATGMGKSGFDMETLSVILAVSLAKKELGILCFTSGAEGETDEWRIKEGPRTCP